MNNRLSAKLKLEFPGIEPFPRPIIELREILDYNWIAGFTDAEGCFYSEINNSKTTKSGKAVGLGFKIGLHARDNSVLIKLQKQLGCGNIREETKVCTYIVRNLNDILTIIIPIFNKYGLQGSKNLNYLGFVK